MTDLLRVALSATPAAPGRVPTIDAPTRDITISCDQNTTSVGELAELLGFVRGPLLIDRRAYPGSATLSETSIGDGSVVANPADAIRSDVEEREPAVVTVWCLAGPNAGRSQDLPLGTFELIEQSPIWRPATTAPTPTTRAILEIQRDRVTLRPGLKPAALDGQLFSGPVSRPIRSTSVLNFGSERFRVEPFEATVLRHPSVDGAVHRIPRVASPAPDPIYVKPAMPKPPADVQPLSWIAMLAPIPGAAILALAIGSSTMLYFAALSPLALIARWYDGKRRSAKQGRDYDAAVQAARADTFHQILNARSAVVAHQNNTNPGPAEVVHRALTRDPRLWERRPAHSDFAVASIAIGEREWSYEPPVPDEVRDLADSIRHLDSVPLTVDLSKGSVGIVGDRQTTLSVARALMIELAVLSGPSDIPIAIVGSDEVLDDWDWAKWLPHLGLPQRLATTNAQVSELVGKQSIEMPKRPGTDVPVHPVSVLFIDGVELLRSGESPLRQALAANNGISGIVLASSEDELPASCHSVLRIDDEGLAVLTDMVTGERRQHLTPVGMDTETASDAARSLARLVDPDASAISVELPSYVSLPSVVGPVSASAVLERWESGGVDPNPIATLGVGPNGPFEVDLVKDGPHGLLAGTTGAGKSEFLRSFVLSMATRFSPEAVNFVLVDYKGGGAFDVCAELPHTVAMVTDLDGHLGARALRSLQAELRFREITFRDAGAHDLGGYRAGGGIMPRLVVVVDEFATLAAELPDFLDALVDIAQRGRSLGIHMILATQRPAGVVDAKIKSNTNLRISLRVQDDADSQDVIGTNDAARLRRSDLGRGFVRMGASDIVPLQSAYAGGVTPDIEATTGILVENFDLRPTSGSTTELHSHLPTDMERMVSEIKLANDKAGISEPRKPWLPELPARLGLESLPPASDGSAAIVVGLMDLPAEQRRCELAIPLGSANTFVYGVEAGHTADTLRTITVQAMASRSADDLHVYLLDSGSAGLRPLRNAPGVGAYVPHDDDDLLSRVLDLITALVAERKAHRADGGDVNDLPTPLVVIDGLGTLFERLNEAGDHVTLSRLGAIVRESAVLGISVVASASTDRQIPSRVSSQAQVKLLHRMADPAAVVSFGLRQRDVPSLTGRMVLDVETGLDGVVASISEHQIDMMLATLEPATVRPPTRLRLLRETTFARDLDRPASVEGSRLDLPIGVRIRDVETAVLSTDDRAVVLGAPGTGRTSTLVQLVSQATTIELDGVITVVAEATSPLASVVGVHRVSPDEVIDDSLLADSSLVIVDDADRVTAPLAEQLKGFADGAGRGKWMIAAMKPSDTKAMMEWTTLFRSSAVGVVLQPLATDGDALKVMFPAKAVHDLRKGQGIMVVNGVTTAIQTATV